MSLVTIIVLVLGLYFIQLFLQETSRFGFDLRAIVGNRDDPPAMSVVAGRLDRAKRNMQESLPIFLALALLALIEGGDASGTARWALTFLIARIAYVPAYVIGVPMLRSGIWLVAVFSLAMMALTVI